MIIRDAVDQLETALELFGVGERVREGAALIKINLARPPEPDHPRTDPALLSAVVRYVLRYGNTCAIAEAANGYLAENLAAIGLAPLLDLPGVHVLDLDNEACDTVTVEGETHFLPTCLRDYAVRIAFPATTKRPNMIFSNNVKLFVGAVPYRHYQLHEPTTWRVRLHVDLHKSVATLYRAMQTYAPFHLFINGGTALFEEIGEVPLPGVFLSDDAVELDHYILDRYGVTPPEYLMRLSEAEPIQST